jgi:hypothetical protein
METRKKREEARLLLCEAKKLFLMKRPNLTEADLKGNRLDIQKIKTSLKRAKLTENTLISDSSPTICGSEENF